MTDLTWRAGPLPGHLYALNPDGTIHATILPSLSHGVVASIYGQRRWYAAEKFAFWEIDRLYANENQSH
jgi:hypothetical protein